ncbi:MAG: hypothetical protein MK102_16070 [Fuerstiella sp.]|nr:hypothetical protein [Fuerstiella sp.]
MRTCVFGIAPSTAQLAICWLLVLVIPDTRAQTFTNADPPAIPPTWDFDFDLFQTLLETQGVESQNRKNVQSNRTDWNRMMADPSKSVIVLTGNIEEFSSWSKFHNFLTMGGVIFVASNEPVDIYGFFKIDFGPVTAPDRKVRWHGHEDCIQVTDLDISKALMKDVSTVVVNRSGWIGRLDNSMEYQWSRLAVLPHNLRPRECAHQPVIAVAHSRRKGNGRLIVMADGSLLSNGMIWHGNNLTLLINLVQELTRDNRNAYVFLNNGQAVENRVTDLIRQAALSAVPNLQSIPGEDVAELSSELPLEAIADLPAETLLDIGNTLATRIDDSDILNQLMADRPRYLADRFYRRSILFTICAAGVTIFLMRSYLAGPVPLPWLRQRRRPDPPETPVVMSVTNYGQATRALARDTCRYLTGSREPKDWLSRLQKDGDLWRTLYARSSAPHATTHTMGQLLSFGTEKENTGLSQQQFERFGKSIHQLRQLHQPPKSTKSKLAWNQDN